MVQKKRATETAMLLDDNAEDEMLNADTQQAHASIARHAARVKLAIEYDLSKLSAEHYKAWNPAADCAENAEQAFQAFMSTSTLITEMNASEIECFRVLFD